MRKLISLSLLIVFLAAAPAPDFADAKTRKTHKKRARYAFHLPSGTLSQKYYLEGSAGKENAENLIAGLKRLGAEEASVDLNKNILNIKFKSGKLSSISILGKLKEFGYTVRRID